MKMTEEMQKMVEVLEKHDTALRRDNSLYKHYFAPNLPEKVMKKLIKYFDSHLPINSVIGFYDSTLFGSSKTGILFTNDGFYYRYIGKAVYFAYKDILGMRVADGNLYIDVNNTDIGEFTLIDVFDMKILKCILIDLIYIDEEHGQSSFKSSGKVKKLDIPKEMLNKCNGIIHGASAACGGVGAGLAQIPASDNAVIVPIQIGMIIGLGSVFDLNITEAGAKSIIASAGASVAGRTVSQFLVGWIPGLGNVINTATAAGLTEAIGWIAVKNFYERWIQDKNKGRFEGMKAGYTEASNEYERKLKKQAEAFINQQKDYEKERDEYEKLMCDYENYIRELEEKCADLEQVLGLKALYADLKNMKSA